MGSCDGIKIRKVFWRNIYRRSCRYCSGSDDVRPTIDNWHLFHGSGGSRATSVDCRVTGIFIKKLNCEVFRITLFPALCIAAIIVLRLSIWAEPGETFRYVMKSSMPASVTDFTHETLRLNVLVIDFQCKIASDDLNRILAEGSFNRIEPIKAHHLADRKIDDRILMGNPVFYGYKASYENHWHESCQLVTNRNHDHIFVTYSGDYAPPLEE